MTLTDEERERVRQVLDRYAAEAPPAPNWGAWEISVRRPRLRPAGPLVALVAAASVVLLIGVPVLVRWVGPDPAPIDSGGPETWRAWYDRVGSEGELNGRDPTIVQGKLGPDPQFDLGSLGVEQSLTPVSQVLGGPPWNLLFDRLVTERETLVVAGSTSDSAIAAVTAGVLEGEGRAGIPVICVAVATPDQRGEWSKGGSCRPASGAVDYNESPLSVGLRVGPSLDGEWVAVAVPPQTSVVGIVAGDARYWQRPRGGLVLFAIDPIEDSRLTSYSTSGEVLAQWLYLSSANG
jgi:hypothetical protein